MYPEDKVSMPACSPTQGPITFEDAGNYVFLGIRRAGKSYLMYQRIHQLLKKGHTIEEILYINFEDERFIGLKSEELDDIKLAYEETFPYQPIFFLDEIQVVDGWEKFVRRLVDKKYRVYVTGSNAKMLSSEIATTLGGRFLIQEVYPYSFREFLLSQDIILKTNWLYTPSLRNEVVRTFDAYFYNGGFPELIAFKDKRSWLSGLYQKIFFGDLVARYALRNSDSMSLLVKKLAESVMQPSSYNRLKNIVSSAGESVGVRTVIDYVGYLEEIGHGESVGIFIGPEGGFDRSELDEAVNAGCEIITLGKRILRTETAGMMLLSVLMYNMEE